MIEKESKISIVIITYNRPDDMLELARNISTLEAAGDIVGDVIIFNNRSTVSYEKVEQFIDATPAIPFRYFVSEKNLGVSGGRNQAIRLSTAPILVFLDDDALFQHPDALQRIQDIFREPMEDEIPKGIVSFKVYYQQTKQLQQNAFPHKQFHKRKHLHKFRTSYFAGCAHAIRRTVFEKAGYYPENFFYGMEEYDLSYRTIQQGFSIYYDDRVSILHKESPGGRLPSEEKIRSMWVNKSKVAWKYLPLQYFYSTAFMWSLEYLKKSGFNLKGFFRGWTSVTQIRKTEHRKPLDTTSLEYLKKVESRCWY